MIRGAGCLNRARPDLWGARVSNHPGLPDRFCGLGGTVAVYDDGIFWLSLQIGARLRFQSVKAFGKSADGGPTHQPLT